MVRFELIGGRFVILRGPGGGTLLATAMLPNETACTETLVAIRLCSAFEDRYERRRARHGGCYFVLKSLDDVVLATSAIHDDDGECECTIDLLLAHASGAPVLDLDRDEGSPRFAIERPGSRAGGTGPAA